MTGEDQDIFGKIGNTNVRREEKGEGIYNDKK